MTNEIEEVLKNFDFEKVRKVMVFLDWKWHGEGEPEIPSIYRMIERSRELLTNACKHKHGLAATGGFVARHDDGFFELSFVLESYEYGVF